jgi:BMFP domain-containing protein YqiC
MAAAPRRAGEAGLIAALEARIEALEARLAALEASLS